MIDRQTCGPYRLVGLRSNSEIYQKFQIFAKLLDHRVRDQKLCLHAKFESLRTSWKREIAFGILKL